MTVPDEVAGDADTVTYVAPGGRYNLELAADWTLDETGAVLVATAPGQSSPMVRGEMAEPRLALDIQAGIDELTADGGADVTMVEVQGALRAWRVDRSVADDDGGIVMIVALSEVAVVTVAVAWTAADEFTTADADRILGSLDLTRSDAGG